MKTILRSINIGSNLSYALNVITNITCVNYVYIVLHPKNKYVTVRNIVFRDLSYHQSYTKNNKRRRT